jgi:hypothetical protein
MTWSRATSHSAKLVAVIIALAAFACSTAARGKPRPHPDNPLPAGVVRDADEFRRTLGKITPDSGNTRARKSTKCFLGIFFCKDLDVRIEAVRRTLDIDPSKPPAPGTGFAVARLINKDPEKKVEKYYRLRHDSEAEYYLWVTAKDADETQWTLIEVPRGSGQVLAAEATDLRLCHLRAPGEEKRSEADFASYRKGGKCTEHYATMTTTESTVKASAGFSIQPLLAILHSVFVLRWAVAEGGWIDCSNGCCT